jgi:hypothetical protein
MRGKISVALLTLSALVLCSARSAVRRSSPNLRSADTVAASVQDDGQQSSQPQNSDEARRDEDARRQNGDDRARSDERRSGAPEEGETVTLPPDTIISVRIADEINSTKNRTGDMFTGIVDPSVMIHDNVVIPRGTEAHVRMAEGKKGGHIHGKAQVSLELVSLIVNGRRLEVESDAKKNDKGALAAKGKAEKQSAEHMGSATGPAGPAGAAAGPVIAVFSAAKVEVKPNTRVEFTLAEPFTFEKPPVTNAQQQ